MLEDNEVLTSYWVYKDNSKPPMYISPGLGKDVVWLSKKAELDMGYTRVDKEKALCALKEYSENHCNNYSPMCHGRRCDKHKPAFAIRPCTATFWVSKDGIRATAKLWDGYTAMFRVSGDKWVLLNRFVSNSAI